MATDAHPDTAPPLRALAGVVRDGAGAPVRDAVLALGDGEEARTDSLGRFRVAVLRLGTQLLYVRALGYQPLDARVAVTPDQPASMPLTLARVTLLGRVNVSARASRLIAEIELRRDRQWGKVVDSTHFARWGTLPSALSTIGGGFRADAMRGPGQRPVCVLLDGMPSDLSGLLAEDVAVAEFYGAEGTGMPMHHAASCDQRLYRNRYSLLIVWTRRTLGQRPR